MQTQTLTITRPTVNHNHTAPMYARGFVPGPTDPDHSITFAPRPHLTRGVAEIWAALTPAQRAEVDAIGKCVNDLLAENPLAARPDAGAVTIWLCEKLGVIWNFTTGAWEWDTHAAE